MYEHSLIKNKGAKFENFTALNLKYCIDRLTGKMR
jgi:hypothetical protein